MRSIAQQADEWTPGHVTTLLFSVSGAAHLGRFQKIKRGRPDGYYQQRLVIWLHEAGLRRGPYIRQSGVWDIGRRE